MQKAEELRADRKKTGDLDEATRNEVEQLDFEFVLFASNTIDYDYIMKLITDFQAAGPGKPTTMSREQLIGLIASDAKFIDEREDISEYVRGLKAGEGLSEDAIRAGHVKFKADKAAQDMAALSVKHGLPVATYRPSSMRSFPVASSMANSSPSYWPRWTWAGKPALRPSWR